MLRRYFVAVLFALGGGLFRSSGAQAQQVKPLTGDANLAETLTYGLRPRLSTEKEFIQLVVAKVEAGVLPLELVISTFRWAQRHKPYPFPHFHRGLRVRAARMGITL